MKNTNKTGCIANTVFSNLIAASFAILVVGFTTIYSIESRACGDDSEMDSEHACGHSDHKNCDHKNCPHHAKKTKKKDVDSAKAGNLAPAAETPAKTN